MKIDMLIEKNLSLTNMISKETIFLEKSTYSAWVKKGAFSAKIVQIITKA